jgi:hypothetical protein
LGSDVPLKNLDRIVSSFAMQLRYEQGLDLEQDHFDVDMMREIQDSEFINLGNTFRKLGFFMMDLGIRIARICDKAIGGQELEQSLLESMCSERASYTLSLCTRQSCFKGSWEEQGKL